LLQRAKNIWLLYDSEADGLGGGEKSRFISQIMQELSAYSPLNAITEVSPLMDSSLAPPNALVVEKDETVMARLLEMAEKGLSPTTMNQYLNCPMRFYFSSVLRLGETDEVEETIDFRTLGTAVHEVMQRFYEQYIGSFPPEIAYNQAIANIETSITDAMNKHYPGGDTTQGRNLLIVKVAETWLKRYLKMEAEANYHPETGDHIIAVEKPLGHTLQINFNNETLAVNLKGMADRIDRVNGLTRVIDYKTGNVHAADLNKNPDAVFNNEKETLPEKAFQLYFYLLMSLHTPGIATDAESLSAGIITFRKLNEGYLSLNIQNMTITEAIDEFESHLKDLLEEMYDASIPFERTEYEKRCTNCLFKVVCARDNGKGNW
jgi:RecB family exonuclease